MRMAISYDHGEVWEESWSIAPDWGESGGITMYPFVSISENNMVSQSLGMDWSMAKMAILKAMNGICWRVRFTSHIQVMMFEWVVSQTQPLYIS